MYASKVVEIGTVKQLFEKPLHPYTEGLLAAVPKLKDNPERLATIPGHVPSPTEYPPGCRFCNRCPKAFQRCYQEQPPLYDMQDHRQVRCFLFEPGQSANPTSGERS